MFNVKKMKLAEKIQSVWNGGLFWKKVMQASIKQIKFNIIIKYLFHYSVYMPGKFQTNIY
jgi:hypothetical protein